MSDPQIFAIIQEFNCEAVFPTISMVTVVNSTQFFHEREIVHLTWNALPAGRFYYVYFGGMSIFFISIDLSFLKKKINQNH